jgi:hypothetical protein
LLASAFSQSTSSSLWNGPAVRFLLLIEHKPRAVVSLFILVREKFDRSRLPLHGRVEVARLSEGSGEGVKVGWFLPFGEFACLGRELNGEFTVALFCFGKSCQIPCDIVVRSRIVRLKFDRLVELDDRFVPMIVGQEHLA